MLIVWILKRFPHPSNVFFIRLDSSLVEFNIYLQISLLLGPDPIISVINYCLCLLSPRFSTLPFLFLYLFYNYPFCSQSAYSHSVMNFLGSSARIKLNTFRVSRICHEYNKYFSKNIAKVPLSAGCCLMTTFDGTNICKKTIH